MTRPAPVDAAVRHEIRYSLLLAVAALLLIVLLGGRLAWLAVVSVLSMHPVLLIAGVLGLAGLVFFVLPFVPETLRALRRREPVVVFDRDGVRDIRNRPELLRWEDVTSIDLGLRRSNHQHLIFTLRDGAAARVHGGPAPRLSRLGRQLVGDGDWHVNLRRLSCRRLEVLEIARRFHREAIRRRVVATSGGPDRGWSGRL
ncbi:MAG: hypothetical protein JNN18_11970 [Rubrivivax sp.]|nr:hypothetical protein [Rubrivivax sp.]